MTDKSEAITEALLPCPFCGGTRVFVQNAGWEANTFIRCPDCEFERAASHEKTVERWNHRAAPRPPSVPVGVKGLKWKDLSYKGELDLIAHTPFHTYHITKDDTCEWPFILRPFVSGQSNYTSIADAKATAQADYEQRVRCALEAAPSAVEIREAALEEAAKAAETFSGPGDIFAPGDDDNLPKGWAGCRRTIAVAIRSLKTTTPEPTPAAPPSREEGLREALEEIASELDAVGDWINNTVPIPTTRAVPMLGKVRTAAAAIRALSHDGGE